MKKRCILEAILASVLVFSGCGTSSGGSDFERSERPVNDNISSAVESVVSETVSQEAVSEIDVSEKESSDSNAETMHVESFKALLSQQPLSVVSVEYVVQDENYKALYPDMLQAIIKNNSSHDIKNAVVAFVAWDSNDLPVKIKSQFEFTDGAYVKEVAYDDINLVPGATFGEENGYAIAEKSNITRVEAVCVSYESFSGEGWENPYYDEWCKLFEGKKYEDSLTVDVVKEETTFFTVTSTVSSDSTSYAHTTSANTVTSRSEVSSVPTVSSAPSTVSSSVSSSSSSSESSSSSVTSVSVGTDEETLNKEIDKQEVRVISTEYVIQSDEYKGLAPDMLMAHVQNNSNSEIIKVLLAFAAWNKDGDPVKLKGNIDFGGPAYVKQVRFDDINLTPGGLYGQENGFGLAEDLNVDSFKAIVVYYETADGVEWNNPLFDDWKDLYEGKSIK